MKSLLSVAIGCFLFFPISAKAQVSDDTCRVNAYWYDQSGRGSGLMLIGRFTPKIDREATIKTFNLVSSGLIVTVGVEYEYENIFSKEPPLSVGLAITVLPKEEKNLFGSTESAQASTLHGKNWSRLSVSKKVENEKLIWTVSLYCENSKGKSRRSKL